MVRPLSYLALTDTGSVATPAPASASLRRGQELAQADLHHRPWQQPVLVRYGDHHLLFHHTVVAFDQLVGEAPRSLVADEGSTILPRRPPRSRKQRRGGNPGIHAEGPRHLLLQSSKADALRVRPHVSLARDTIPPASPPSLRAL